MAIAMAKCKGMSNVQGKRESDGVSIVRKGGQVMLSAGKVKSPSVKGSEAKGTAKGTGEDDDKSGGERDEGLYESVGEGVECASVSMSENSRAWMWRV